MEKEFKLRTIFEYKIFKNNESILSKYVQYKILASYS